MTQRALLSGLVAPVVLFAACSQGPSALPTRQSNAYAVPGAGDDGRVGALAAGDLKVGSGPLEIVRLRMDRQSSPGVSVLRQYADPSQTYTIEAGETIEFWAEYPAGVSNPKFKVEWGDGGADATSCGSCLLRHRYPNGGLYTVKASLDDRVSTMVTRTFFLGTANEAGPSFTPIPQPDAAYLASTTKIDISGLAPFSNFTTIAGGGLTVTFGTAMNKRVVPSGWASWSSPPDSESATPHVLYSSGATVQTLTLSQPVAIFGFELEPDPFSFQSFSAQFILMSGPTVVGVIPITLTGSSGARLFAASVTGTKIDKVMITGSSEFALGQVRFKP